MNPNLKLKYVDRPEIPETYVDLMEKGVFEGGMARLEFCVIRMNEPKPPSAPTGKKLTACRLVMPLTEFAKMAEKFGSILAQFERDGIVQREGQQTATGKPN